MKKQLILILSLLSIMAFSTTTLAAKPDGVGRGKPDFAGKQKEDKVKGPKEDKVKGAKSNRGKSGKVSICHNGSTFDATLQEDVPISFIINTSKNALRAHLENHDDCDQLFEEGDVIQECELQDDGVTILCEEKVSCTCLDVENLPEEEL